MRIKKIQQILPGDLICDRKPGRGRTFPVLIVSITEDEILFMLAGDDFLYSATRDQDEYYLLSRIEAKPLSQQ
jgi:hypothetical protein